MLLRELKVMQDLGLRHDNHNYKFLVRGNLVIIATMGLLTIYEHTKMNTYRVYSKYECDADIIPSIVLHPDLNQPHFSSNYLVFRQSKYLLVSLALDTKLFTVVQCSEDTTPSELFATSLGMTTSGILIVGDPGSHDNIGSALLFTLNGKGVWEAFKTLSPVVSCQGTSFGRVVSYDEDTNSIRVGSINTATGHTNTTIFLARDDEWELFKQVDYVLG